MYYISVNELSSVITAKACSTTHIKKPKYYANYNFDTVTVMERQNNIPPDPGISPFYTVCDTSMTKPFTHASQCFVNSNITLQ